MTTQYCNLKGLRAMAGFLLLAFCAPLACAPLAWPQEAGTTDKARRADKPKDNAAVAEEIRLLREELRQALAQQDARLAQMAEALRGLQSKPAEPPPAPKPPADTPPPAPAPPAAAKVSGTVTVCNSGCDFQDLQKAVDAAPSGGTVSVAAEVNGTCAVINKPLRLLGQRDANGGRPHFAGGICWGKAPFVTMAPNILIDGFEISGVKTGDGNGACIRIDPGTRDLVIRNVYCHDSQMAVLGGDAGRLLIEDSVFERTAPNASYSHLLYLSDGNEAVIRRCKLLSATNLGHTLKSGYKRLLVEDSVIAALNGHNSRAIDAYGGGDIVLRGNVIQQGAESDNNDIIAIALEPKRLVPTGHALLMERNWVLFDDAKRWHKVLIRGQHLGPLVVRDNVFVGLTGIGEDGVTQDGNRWFDSRENAGLPKFDGSLNTLPEPGRAAPAPN
ncbi:MAG: hypothetical protein ACKN9T_01065 [Candidatus Methylumidiphilus sp.]